MKKIPHPLLYILPFLLTAAMLSAFTLDFIGIGLFSLYGGVTGFQVMFFVSRLTDYLGSIIYVWIGAGVFWLLFLAVVLSFLANAFLCVNHIFHKDWFKAVSIAKVYKLTLILGWIVVGFFALIGIGIPVVLNILYSNLKIVHLITGNLFSTQEYWPIIIFLILVIGRKHVVKHVPEIEVCAEKTPKVKQPKKVTPKENNIRKETHMFKWIIRSIFFKKLDHIDITTELKKYKELLDGGFITQKDYDNKKAELLNFWW